MIINYKLTIFTILLSTVLVFGCNNCKPSKGSFGEEKFRPQFHFSPKEKWMNDPNGMVYYKGEYHLFYQYYPDSTVWGPMHWGHAISKDLIHWKHLPIALYPDSLGYIFSGSAVIDWKNITGFGSEDNPPMVAIYTYHNIKGERSGRIDFQYQAIAYSLDKGRSWTKYEGNPVISNPGIRDFRDPKVFWYEDSNKWMMILAVKDRVRIYSSTNLKEWFYESDFGAELGAHGGVWECPDLFSIQVEGSNITKWVMLVSIGSGAPNGGSATQYFVGEFDGKVFIPDAKKTRWLDYGKDNYAGVTWSGVPKEDGRRLFIGWMSNWKYAQVVPTEKWRSAMTLSRELMLVNDGDQNKLVSFPVKEFEDLKALNFQIKDKLIAGELSVKTQNINLSSCEIDLVFKPLEGSLNGNTTAFGLLLKNSFGEELKLGYNMLSKQVFIDRRKVDQQFSDSTYLCEDFAPYEIGEKVKMKIIFDASSVEMFVDDGEIVMTDVLFPATPFNKLSLFSSLGTVELKSADFFDVETIW